VGAAAAAAMLAARTGDGRFSPFTVIQGTEPGEWRSTAFTSTGAPVVEPAPWVGNVDPFIVPDVEALRSDGPNPLTSQGYAEDFNEVKDYGSLDSTVRTADQTEAAVFWQANGAGLFNALFRQLAGTQDLDIAEAARMFAMADLTGADGAIACWNDKYYYRFWRRSQRSAWPAPTATLRPSPTRAGRRCSAASRRSRRRRSPSTRRGTPPSAARSWRH